MQKNVSEASPFEDNCKNNREVIARIKPRDHFLKDFLMRTFAAQWTVRNDKGKISLLPLNSE